MGYARRHFPDPNEKITLLCDVRGQARPLSIQVWSFGKRKVVNAGRSIVVNETPDAKRWCAITMPRWLAVKEGLFGAPDRKPGDLGVGQQERSENMEHIVSAFVAHTRNASREHDKRMKQRRINRVVYEGGISAGGNVYESPGR